MQANNWMPYPEYKPTEEKQYLVTQQITSTRKIISLRGWSNNLYKKDPCDFFKDQDRPGWYDYDSEWGYFEVPNVIGWQEAPDPMQ